MMGNDPACLFEIVHVKFCVTDLLAAIVTTDLQFHFPYALITDFTLAT